jgi:uncharacterized protein with GYD domain
MGAAAPKRAAKALKDEVTHFFLVKHTERGAVQTPAFKKKGINDVTKAVRKEGGQCHLYMTRGATFDYVSVITGVSHAGAVRIAVEIEKRGTVKATLCSGVEMFNP